MRPQGVIRVYAMARPRRPASEVEAVRAAAGTVGTASARAHRVAGAVTVAAMKDVDTLPDEEIMRMLRALDPSPVAYLATSPEVDTAALICAARVKRLQARGGRRIPEAEWKAEDVAVRRTVTRRLARRYADHLREK